MNLKSCFNTQPPEGGCIQFCHFCRLPYPVSTHSHPKVAAQCIALLWWIAEVSTHSHPKVAATAYNKTDSHRVGFNTQPPEGGCWMWSMLLVIFLVFQHTATRRWLHKIIKPMIYDIRVSTHSHPKVAANGNIIADLLQVVSTHSHPKVAAPKP